MKRRVLKTAFNLVLIMSIVFTTLIVGGTNVSAAASYYVSTTGDDSNPGTLASPWKTIQKAADTVAAGDTVYLRGGTYSQSNGSLPNKVVVNVSGSSGNYITFASYPGETVTIDGTGISLPSETAGVEDWQGLIQVTGKSFLKFIGLRVVNSDWAGILVESNSHDIIIQNNYIYSSRSGGIIVQTGYNFKVLGNEIDRGSNDSTVDPHIQEVLSVQLNVTNFEVANNYVHDYINDSVWGGEGIDAKNGASSGTIHNNEVTRTTSVGIYIDSWDQYQSYINVYNNLVHDVAGSSGFSLSSENGGTLEYCNVYNNIIYNNLVGMRIPAYGFGTIRNAKITNNTFYANGSEAGSGGGGLSIGDWSGAIVNLYVRNNIFSQNYQYSMKNRDRKDDSNKVFENNLIDGYKEYTGEGFTEIRGTNYVEGSPNFVDAAAYDFHLQSTSPAIDAGTPVDAPSTDYDGNYRPQMGGYDIGAFEYVSGELIPTPVTTPTPTPEPTIAPPAGGGANLTASRIPTFSTEVNEGVAERLTDGDINTDNYVALYAEGPQWAQVDFGESYNVERIKLWHYYGDGRTFHDVIMQLSNTADFSSGVTTVFNNDADNSAGQGVGTDAEYAGTGSGKGVTFSDVNARYVRVWSNGNSSNGSHYYVELQVYRALTEADGYIPSTLTAYTDAIAAATAVEANADATQAEIDAAEAAVDTAKAALAFVDQEALDAAEAAAAAKVEADYTPTSWAAFGAALAAANALPERSNADVVAKTTAINDAIALLAPKPVPVVTKEGHTTTVSFIIEATVDPATGTAAAKVEANIFSELVSLAKKAEASGQKAVVVLKDSVAADTKSVVVEIPRDAFNELAKGTKADVKVDTGIGTAAFNAKAVDSISGAANAGNIFISITRIDTSVLTPEVQTKVGDKPVFEFSVKAGNTKISDFNEENVEIGIPYTPKLGEKNSSVVYYIDNTGGLKIAKGKYDPEDGTVNFKISHF